jgi:hypothetical protein
MNCADATALIPLYLSGELGGEQGESRLREFGKHLQHCEECAREVSLQMAMDARLRAAVLADAVDSRATEVRVLRSIAAGSAQRRRAWSLALAAAAVVAVGAAIFAGYGEVSARNAVRLVAAAAKDHRIEIVDGQPRRWQTDLASINELALREGISSAMIPAIAPAGYYFREAKLCRLDGAVYLHLVYSDGTGSRKVSVFLDGEDSSYEKIYGVTVGAEHVAGFENGHCRVVIVTDQAGDAALRFAQYAARVI